MFNSDNTLGNLERNRCFIRKQELSKLTKKEAEHLKRLVKGTGKVEVIPAENVLDPDTSFVGEFIKPFKEQIIPSSDSQHKGYLKYKWNISFMFSLTYAFSSDKFLEN